MMLRTRTGLLLWTGLIFLAGFALASRVEWRGSYAAASVQTQPPPRAQLRQVGELSDAFIAIAEAVTPAVVRIQTEHTRAGRAARLPHGLREFFRRPDGAEPRVPQLSGGSGSLVTSDGYVLTNNHVIEGAERILVTLLDKRTFEARVVGRDPTTDIAVIKIEAESLPAARLGDSDQARVGEWVLAVGNPGFSQESTLDFTVTSGIISAKGRPLNIIGQELLAHDDPAANYAIDDFMQTDAVINPGNSGGPLVNLRGELIGINTAIASQTGFYQGYGFAIPINLARRVMKDLIEHGHVRRALLGISITDVSPEDAEVYRLPGISGVLIEDFSEDSPARRAGLERHDVIVAINGQAVERVGQLQRLIAQHQPGESVEVRIVRFGAPRRFAVQLTQAPIASRTNAPARRSAAPARQPLGIQISELTLALAQRYGYERAGGALIADVLPFSAADRKQVIAGSRILAINRRPIASAREAESLLARLRSGDVVSLEFQEPDGRHRIANLRVP